MKNTGFILLATTVILAVIVITCEPDAQDSWEPVSAVNEIAGGWEGSFSIKVPAEGDFNKSTSKVFGDVTIPATSIFYEHYIIEYEEDAGEISAKTKIVYDKLLEDTVKANKGYTKDSLWANLEAFYDSIKDYMDVAYDKYYVAAETTSDAGGFDLSAVYLDKDKKRLKLVLPLSQTYKQEIILQKAL